MVRFIQVNILLYFFLLILGISGFFFAVIWPHSIGFYAFIVFAATGGLGVASYIYRTKKRHEQLVCPTGSDCNAVVNSRYAKFMGISLEYWGMLYYSIIFVSYIVLIFAPHLFSKLLLSGLMLLTLTAFLFSLYLLFVQAFLLRQWCIWCLLSATLSIAIFITSLASVDYALAFLLRIETVIGAFHALGFALGVGGVTAMFILFSRFLRDFNIDEGELQTLKGIFELVWIGLAFVLIGQFSYFITYADTLSRSGPFLAQTTALFVAAVSSAVLMIIFAPFLVAMPFSDTAISHRHSPLDPLRRPFFITGAVALLSWYFAFMMNYTSEYKPSILFLVYIIVLVVAVAVALLWEKRIRLKDTEETD